MDKATRDSVAVLWETMVSAIRGGTLDNWALIEHLMKGMDASLKAGGYTQADVAKWIREDKLEIEGFGDAQSMTDQEKEREEHLLMAEALIMNRYKILNMKEKQFLESVVKQIKEEERFLSPKQKKWLFDIARRYGV